MAVGHSRSWAYLGSDPLVRVDQNQALKSLFANFISYTWPFVDKANFPGLHAIQDAVMSHGTAGRLEQSWGKVEIAKRFPALYGKTALRTRDSRFL